MARRATAVETETETGPQARDGRIVYGHDAAIAEFCQALEQGRMHHAWLIVGPEGIGKASLAYCLARHMLAIGDRPVAAARFQTGPDDPTAHRMAAQAHPDLFVLERRLEPGKDRLPQVVPVEQVRKLGRFFGATAAEGGWRVAIIDSADDLNRFGANAILKTLEEPPARSILFITANMPGRLPPTIRSRCRVLHLQPLGDDDLKRALDGLGQELPEGEAGATILRAARGSVSRAVQLLDPALKTLTQPLAGALETLPRLDPLVLHALGDRLAASRGDTELTLFLDAVRDHLAGLLAKHHDASAARLAPLAEVWEKIETTAEQVRTYNLERKLFVFLVFRWLAALSRAT